MFLFVGEKDESAFVLCVVWVFLFVFFSNICNIYAYLYIFLFEYSFTLLVICLGGKTSKVQS